MSANSPVRGEGDSNIIHQRSNLSSYAPQSANKKLSQNLNDGRNSTEQTDTSLPNKRDNTNSEPIRLQRRLGLWNGVAVIIGVIVGSGIFISPREVFNDAGSMGAALIVWFTCGILSLMGALCMAELGTSIPDSGGDYSYIKMAYGPCVSFLYLWVTVLIILPASNALAALTFANYVVAPFVGAESCPPQNAIRLFALAIILVLAWVNCYSVKWSIRLQNAFTLAKVLALMLVISFGLYYIISDGGAKFSNENIWLGKPLTFIAIAKAFYAGLYSYAGWNALNFVTEEIKDPVKNMPRAIIISITTITIIYVLTNMAYFAVLTPDEFAESQAVAVSFGKKTLGAASFLMPLFVALSTTSGLNALIFSSSRILFVGARQGQLFSLLNMISIDHLTPVPSLIIVAFMSSLYLITTHISSLIDYVVFVEASFGALGVSTVLVLRRKFPNVARPIRVHTYIPVLYLILSILLILTPVLQNPTSALIGTFILITGVPVYYLTANWQDKPRLYQQSIDRLNRFTQKLTLSVPQEDEEQIEQLTPSQNNC